MADKNAFLVNVNGQNLNITPEAAEHLDVITPLSIQALSGTSEQNFHIIKGEKNYQARVLFVDKRTKTYQIKINGTIYTAKVNDKYDRLIDQMGLKIGASQKMTDVKAPMPGLVLDIAVEVGQKVEKGEKILILEAMKMENIIKAAGEGTVKAIHTSKGAAVEKGQILIEMA